MESRQPAAYGLLLMLTIVFTILAIVTLIPNPGASKPNVLGYKSVCTFAPAATLLLGLLAGITCTVRNRMVSEKKDEARRKSLLFPAAVMVILLGGAAASTAVYAQAQSHFGGVISAAAPRGVTLEGTPDGTWIGTVTEADVSATVEVTVKGGRIAGLRLTEGQNIEPSVAQKIFQEVQAAQQTDVDAVSGATASSSVLLKAIEYALQDDK